MDDLERYVYDIMKDKGVEDYFQLDSIREIAGEILSDSQTKNLTVEKIYNSKSMERDI